MLRLRIRPDGDQPDQPKGDPPTSSDNNKTKTENTTNKEERPFLKNTSSIMIPHPFPKAIRDLKRQRALARLARQTEHLNALKMARQNIAVPDLFAVLGLPRGSEEALVREAYDGIVKKAAPDAPSKAMNIAFDILTHPQKRAQYERDHLDYLYTHFSSKGTVPPTQDNETNDTSARDEQIAAYAVVLDTTDPFAALKIVVGAELKLVREELVEFHKMAPEVREKWPTSKNRIFRAAAFALGDLIGACEEEVDSLENELGQLGDKFLPKGTEGPAMSAKPSGLGHKGGDSLGSDIISEYLGTMTGEDRVNQFLLGRASAAVRNGATDAAKIFTQEKNNEAGHHAQFHMYARDLSDVSTTITNENANSLTSSTLDKVFPQKPIGMGLVEWQALHGELADLTIVDNKTHQAGNAFMPDSFKKSSVPAFRPEATDFQPQAPFTRMNKAATPSTEAAAIQPATAQGRTAGIKDFQVRVWSAAKAAKTSPSGQDSIKETEHGGHHVAVPGKETSKNGGPSTKDPFQ